MTSNNTGYDADALTRFYNIVKFSGINPYDYTYQAFFGVERKLLVFFPAMTYQTFHVLIICLLGFICIYPYVLKYVIDPTAVVLLYILSGMFAVDGMQFKNFISVCLLTLALCFYTDWNCDRRSVLFFFIVLSIAIAFHFSFSFYLIVPLSKSKIVKRTGKLFPLFGGILYCIFLFGGNLQKNLIILVSQIRYLAKARFYVETNAGIRSLVPFLIYYIILFSLYYIEPDLSYMRSDKIDDKKRRDIEIFSTGMIRIWEMMGFFLFILNFANATYRLYRNLYILIFTLIANYIRMISEKKKKTSAIMLAGLIALLVFIYPILIGHYIDIYIPVIHGDFFWTT